MTDALRAFAARVAALLRRRSLDSDLDQELRSHVEMAIEWNLQRGMTAEQARREALLSFGGIEQTKEIYREQRGLPLLQSTLQDIRFGFRVLRRSPGFSLLAVLCLTLGIGANAAVFSWIEGVLFRPYPLVSHQEQLIALSQTIRGRGEYGGQADFDLLSWPDFVDLQKNCTLFDFFFVSTITGSTIDLGDRADVMTGSIVSANYFDAIGVHPFLGRGFQQGEDVGRNAHPVVVISYQAWKGRFSGNPEIIGKPQRLNGVVHTIIGVTPEGFYGTFVGRAMQFWVPVSMQEKFGSGDYALEDRGVRWIESFARLKPGVTVAQAQQEISAVAARLENDYPRTNRGRGVQVWPLWQTPFNNARTLLPTLEIMFVVAAFVLFIACANVGNLLLVRTFARRHEMTMRAALGAEQSRLLKQLLTEGLILSALGAAGGLVVAYWCRSALAPMLSRYLEGQMDWRVLSVSAGVCLLVTLLLGLVPALHSRNLNLAGALKAESAGVFASREKTRFRSALVMIQVALSFVLLVGAGLLMFSLQKIRTTSPGFSTNGVLDTSVNLVAAGYDAQRAQSLQDALLDRVRALPGVESASVARIPPLSLASYSSSPIAVDWYQVAPGEEPAVEYNEVGPAYFATLGIPLASGREFTRADDEKGALVAVVNETMAGQFWKDRNPIGQRLQVKGRWMTVVGVAQDSKYESVREDPKPFFYVPLRQNFYRDPDFFVRTSLGPESITPALIREVRALDSNLALFEVITLQEQLDRSTAPHKVAVTLVGVLGGLALLLASIGLYGVMSYAVSQGSRELGLRMALGASESGLLRLVMSRGLMLTGGGILLGAAAALGLTRLLANMLFNVNPLDPRAFGLALAAMIVVSIAACLFPALGAARTDPMRALRME